MATVKQLEAGELPVSKIFSADFDFEIPDYQRPYAWQVDQAAQLLDDLEDALDGMDDEPYFLGSIVLVKTKGIARSEVIDGQQRLTTLTILLALLRDLAEDLDLQSELRDLVREPGSKISGTKPKPRLTLRKRDAQFFRDYVQQPGRTTDLVGLEPEVLKTDAMRAILANTKALRTRLIDWPEARREELAAMLGSRTYLVVVSTPDLASAHRIFSVMNSRGLDLSPADIFKANVIGSIEDDQRALYAEKWENEEEELGRDSFADLFLHLRMIAAKVRGRRELLQEFPAQVLNAFLPDRAEVFVDEVLLPYADAYADLLGEKYANGPGSDLVNTWLQRLHQIDNNDWRPPALWILRQHGQDAALVAALLQRLERLAASMLIRRVYATPRVSRYAELLKELDIQRRGLESPSFELSTEESAETISRLRGDLYLVQPVRRYVLLRLDELLARQPGVTYHHKMITVEHVLPQNLRPDSEWVALFDKDARAEWTHKLANLVLLNRAKNAEAQNFDFTVKKSKYFTGPNGVSAFALTTQVIDQPAWTPNTLEQRQRQLLALLTAEWKLVEA